MNVDAGTYLSFKTHRKLPSMALDSGIPAGMTTFLVLTEAGSNYPL
jgi:hypothetical protein